MIEKFRLIFPYLVVLYFIIKGIKEPLYLLAIPFLMFMSESIFFDSVKIFKIPGSLTYGLMFIWLIFLWVVSIIIRKNNENEEVYNSRRLNGMDYCIIGLLIISFIGLGMTILNYTILTDVFKEFFVLISLFVCYFIIKNWSSHNKPELIVNFLFSLVVINSIAALFYIIHQGLHINIYPTEEYSADIVQGVEITRTFYFMPQFLAFSVAFLLVFRKKRSFVFYILLIINLLAIFISYTRSFLINAAFIFLSYFILVGLKNGRMGQVVKNVLVYGVMGIIGLFILSKILPANTKFFMNRFSELKETSVTSGPNNIEYRFMMTGIIVSGMDADKKVLGMGPVSENQITWVREMKATTADMVWTGVIFRWGFVGLILFIMIFIFSIVLALNFFMQNEGVLSELALLFLLFIISQIIESFVSWTFMSGHGFATGLWYFGMLSALVGFSKKNELLAETTN